MSENQITITDVMHHTGHLLYTQMVGIHSVYTRIGMIHVHVVAESNRHLVIPQFLFQNEVNQK